MDLGQGFPILAHLGTGLVFMGGRSAYCMVWSDVPGVHPADARSIPCCAIQKPSLGIVPYPLEEEVTVTPVEDGLWKGRQDGVRGGSEEESRVVSGLQNTWDRLEAICRALDGSPIR